MDEFLGVNENSKDDQKCRNTPIQEFDGDDLISKEEQN